MEHNYDKWLSEETERFQKIQRKSRRNMLIQTIFVIPGCIVGIAGLNLLSGGVPADAIAMGIRYGLMFGGAVTLLCLLCLLSYRQPSHFQKFVKKQAEEQLPSSGDRELFAQQMLGREGNPQPIQLVFLDGKKHERDFVSVTQDYIAWSTATGNIWIARLKDTAQLEFDAKKYQHTFTAGDKKMRTTDTMYPICFYYRQNETLHSDKRKPDQVFVFQQESEVRQILEAIKRTTGETT